MILKSCLPFFSPDKFRVRRGTATQLRSDPLHDQKADMLGADRDVEAVPVFGHV